MSNYSGVLKSTNLISVIDSDAPGVGHWVEEPHAISNDEIVASYVNPDADFDGGPLTGLKTTYRVQGIASGGVHPFDGLSATDILVMEGQPGITIDKKVLDGSSPGQKEAIGWSATVDVTYGHAIFWSD